jgi:transglutaminase-like putative cysteine protease
MGADFVFNIQAARTPQQSVVWEQLSIRPYAPSQETVDPATSNRMLRLHAPAGRLAVDYHCTVDIRQHTQDPAAVPEVPVAQLPTHVLPYLYPSRYCPSDSMGALANSLFGHLPPGYSRVAAVVAWVQQQVRFQSNTSHSGTNALDTLRDRTGVCRDFAHLTIALCRAINIPARFTTGIDYGADPALGPSDFHAYVEVYLGHRWYIFDPSATAIPMGFIRIGTGRDAADVSFATIFGAFTSVPPLIEIRAEDNPSQGFELPKHVKLGVSTA